MILTVERKVKALEELQPNTIALDGAVRGPFIDVEKAIYSFDHHEGCIRHSTRSTCEQVRDAILLGLDPTSFDVLVNDVDGDTVMSVWLLSNPGRVSEDFVRQLVEEVGLLDSHGPAYPTGGLADAFHKSVMAPQVNEKRNKTYGSCDLSALLQDCLKLLDGFIANPVSSLVEEKPRTYKITHEGNGFIMAESDSFIFDLLYKAGFTKAVAYSQMKDGSFAYSIGKKSEFVQGFPVRKFLDELNGIEPGWGGGTTIGGAPRNPDGSRSGLSPDRVFELLSEMIG